MVRTQALTKTDTHLRSLKGYDETEILLYSTQPFCLTGADAEHKSAPWRTCGTAKKNYGEAAQ
jgi:hypothetical protein